MSIKNFLNKDNLSMIWDVISDEDIFKSLPRELQTNVGILFNNNLKGFYDNEITHPTNLMDMNKRYIILILNYIKQKFSNTPQNKIKIHDEILPSLPSKELVTYEEIQNNRQTQFEKDLNKKQEEFTNAMTQSKPSVPEFKDTLNEGPITEMEKIIKEMTSQRNYEVEQISKAHKPPDSWLQSQETSVKNEKIMLNNNTNNSNTNNSNIPDKRKNVTWGNNSEISESLQEDNIFSKLKKVGANNTTLDNSSENIHFEILESSSSQIQMSLNNDDKILHLEQEIRVINNKMDMIINLLKQNK